MAYLAASLNGISLLWASTILFFAIDRVMSTGCEKEGPCGQDRFCSPSRDICRPCDEIANRCSDRITILARFKECDAFCFKKIWQETEKKLNDTEESLEKAQAERDRLNNTVIDLQKDAGTKGMDWRHWLLIGLLALTVIIIVWLLMILRNKCTRTGTADTEQSELKELLFTTPGHTEATAPPVEEGYATGSSNSPQTTPPEQRQSHIHVEETQQHSRVLNLALPHN